MRTLKLRSRCPRTGTRSSSQNPPLSFMVLGDPAGHCCHKHHHAGLQGVFPTVSTEYIQIRQGWAFRAPLDTEVTAETHPERPG